MSTGSRTPYTILGCLTVEPMSGYDIKQFVDDSIAHFWSESYGQIYPTLRRLEDEGLVEGHAEPSERGAGKRVYRITEAGRRKLEDWLQEPAAPATARYEHSLKLFFGYNADVEASLAHIRRLATQTREALPGYREWETRLAERAADEPGSSASYWLIVLRGGIRYGEMVLEWCEESESALKAIEARNKPDQGAA